MVILPQSLGQAMFSIKNFILSTRKVVACAASGRKESIYVSGLHCSPLFIAGGRVEDEINIESIHTTTYLRVNGVNTAGGTGSAAGESLALLL